MDQLSEMPAALAEPRGLQGAPGASRGGWRSMARKIACLALIFAGIQALNQFLIFSGAALEGALGPGQPTSRTVVGIYQQLVQAAAGIGLYRWLFKKGARDLGLTTDNWRLSRRYFCRFALLWSLIIALYLGAAYFLFPGAWADLTAVEPPRADAMIATLLFQAFFPGMGEEILFRGLIINVLAAVVFTGFERRRASRLGIVACSSAYFAVAHIYFRLAPLEITHIDPLQIATALGCGAFYAIAYLRTRSLLAPFLAHNVANTSTTICGYLLAGL